jgi:hypothetical protein
MDNLKCKIAYYSYLFSGKLMWGLDCDIEQLEIELYKLYTYLKVYTVQQSSNECCKIPVKLEQKVNNYIKSLSKRTSKFCKSC